VESKSWCVSRRITPAISTIAFNSLECRNSRF
jgi:hypothetical protein